MKGFGTLVATESRVWLRDPTQVFFALAFPVILLVGIGMAVPGMKDVMTGAPDPWGSVTVVAAYVPTVLVLGVLTIAFTTMPVTFATFREKGVLRRLSTTPMPPQNMVVAHLVINLVAAVVAAVLALVGGMLAFDLAPVQQPAAVLLCFLLAVAALYSFGTLLAARAPRGSTASGLGMLLYFPSMLLAGVWTPGPVMPDGLREFAQWTPPGAAAQGLTQAWFLGEFPTQHVLVMLAWTVVLLPLSARIFRWT